MALKDQLEAFATRVAEEVAAVRNESVPVAGVAGLDTVGWGRMVFIDNGDEVPDGTAPYTLVIEGPA